MTQTRPVLSLAFVLVFAACAPTTRVPEISDELAAEEARKQRAIVVQEQIKQEQRLSNIAYPILANNLELCGDDVGYSVGTKLTSADLINKDFRGTYAELFGVARQPTVVIVAPGSAAAQLGLGPGDVIAKIDGRAVPEGKRGLETWDRAVERSEGAPISVLVRNGETVRTVNVTPQSTCKYGVHLKYDDAVNAYADGSNLVIHTGMLRFAESDEELAIVVGHELAHNAMGHIDARQGNMLLGALFGAVLTGLSGVDVTNTFANIGATAYSQGFEAEADYVGTYATARAGFDVSNAANFWRRMAATHPESIHLKGGTHPSTATRYLSIEQTASEIANKRAAGLPLVPEERN